MNPLLQTFRHSHLFLGTSLLIVWGCFYGVLRLSDKGGATPFQRTHGTRHAVRSSSGQAKESATDATDVLEQESKTFTVGELRLSSLARILADVGLTLDYPATLDAVTLTGGEYSGKPLSEILVDLFRPHAYGVYRQGNHVHVVPMQLRHEVRQRSGEDPSIQSSLLRTTLRGVVSEPMDLWIESEPLLRLRIVAQPLYGEADENPTPHALGLSVEAVRNQQLWFRHTLEGRLGQASQIELKGPQIM